MVKPYFTAFGYDVVMATAFLQTEERIGRNLLSMLALCAGGVIASIFVCVMTGISIDFVSFLPIGLVLLTAFACWHYTAWRDMKGLHLASEFFLASTLISICVLLYSYATLRAAGPLADGLLARGDAAIGLHVPTIVAWVDENAALSWLLERAYDSIGVQLIFLPIILAVTGDRDRACRMLVAYLLVCFVGCTISIGYPSVGSFAHFGIQPDDLQNLQGAIGYHFQESFFAARQPEPFELSLGLTSGVITFPSIHAAIAIVCVWAAWPIRILRMPMLVLNAAMFVSTIPVGAHYGVDLIGGSVLALAVIAACRARKKAARSCDQAALFIR